MAKFNPSELMVTDDSGNRKLFHIDVYKTFARSKSEAIAKFKRSVKTRAYLQLLGADINKISQAKIEEDKGREGNWNDYVKEFEHIKPKKGESWYEYGLLMDTVPKR
jgi:hypothetical protein